MTIWWWKYADKCCVNCARTTIPVFERLGRKRWLYIPCSGAARTLIEMSCRAELVTETTRPPYATALFCQKLRHTETSKPHIWWLEWRAGRWKNFVQGQTMKLLRKMLYITARLGDGCANDGNAVPLAVKQGGRYYCALKIVFRLARNHPVLSSF